MDLLVLSLHKLIDKQLILVALLNVTLLLSHQDTILLDQVMYANLVQVSE